MIPGVRCRNVVRALNNSNFEDLSKGGENGRVLVGGLILGVAVEVHGNILS